MAVYFPVAGLLADVIVFWRRESDALRLEFHDRPKIPAGDPARRLAHDHLVGGVDRAGGASRDPARHRASAARSFHRAPGGRLYRLLPDLGGARADLLVL